MGIVAQIKNHAFLFSTDLHFWTFERIVFFVDDVTLQQTFDVLQHKYLAT